MSENYAENGWNLCLSGLTFAILSSVYGLKYSREMGEAYSFKQWILDNSVSCLALTQGYPRLIKAHILPDDPYQPFYGLVYLAFLIWAYYNGASMLTFEKYRQWKIIQKEAEHGVSETNSNTQ